MPRPLTCAIILVRFLLKVVHKILSLTRGIYVVTHEPKLARAKRLIPEWTLYDDEVAALASRVAAESSQGSEIVNAEIGAFSRNADELAQAVEQKAERDEFVEAESKAEDIEPAPYVDTPRLKDEL